MASATRKSKVYAGFVGMRFFTLQLTWAGWAFWEAVLLGFMRLTGARPKMKHGASIAQE